MKNKFILTLDIGGTNPRIAMVKVNSKNLFEIIEKKDVEKDSKSIILSINNFLKELGDKNITTDTCVISIAGVVKNNSCLNPPNAKFSIDSFEILEKTYLKNILVINDFVAIGNAVSNINIKKYLNEKKIIQVKLGVLNKNGNRGVIGAGSGLGVSNLIKNENGFIISASEGGHMGIQESYDDCGLFDFIREDLKIKQIGTEALVSGRGICNIFKFISNKNYQKDDDKILKSFKNKELDSAALIANFKSQNAQKTMQIFIKYLAIASQNIALNGLTVGGLFIGGGIVLKNLYLFKNNVFETFFINNWKQSDLLKNIPVYVILDYDISFYGCAKAACDKFNYAK